MRGDERQAKSFKQEVETLCRTVAMLRVPVVSAIGHERDSTLIDDVAAVCCSTPTHAAEAAVPLDCFAARRELERGAGSLRRAGERAVGSRARHLAARARGPARALQRERSGLNQKIREIRAASERGLAERARSQGRIAGLVLERARRRGIERTAAGAEEAARRSTGPPRRGCAAVATPSAMPRWHCALTTRSGRWSAATRWPRPPMASR